MAYVPNADDSAAPLDTEYASTAAREFRTLKAKINGFFIDSNFNTLQNANYSTKGLALVNQGPGTIDIMYGLLANPIRTASTGSTFGVYVSTVQGAGISVAAGGAVKGIVSEVFTETLNSVAESLVGIDNIVCNRNPEGQDTIIGQRIRFQDRLSALDAGAVVGGLADDKYNNTAKALVISSQRRSTEGEKCGWSRGIVFEDYCMDEDDTITVPKAIDFAGIAVTDSAEPVIAFNFAVATLDALSVGAGGGTITPPVNVTYWLPVTVGGVVGFAIPVYDLVP